MSKDFWCSIDEIMSSVPLAENGQSSDLVSLLDPVSEAVLCNFSCSNFKIALSNLTSSGPPGGSSDFIVAVQSPESFTSAMGFFQRVEGTAHRGNLEL